MNIWVETIIYFFVAMLLMGCVLDVYGKVLRMSGRQTDLVKLSISLIAFVTCSICVVAVFSVGFKINPSWKELFDENELYMTFYLICYALSFIPGLMAFKNRHVVELKKLGVF